MLNREAVRKIVRRRPDSISQIVKGWERGKQDLLEGRDDVEITCIPLAPWIDALVWTEVFSNPKRNKILKCYLKGSATRPVEISPKDKEKFVDKLMEEGLLDFIEVMVGRTRYGIRYPRYEGEAFTFNYDRKYLHPVKIRQLCAAAHLGRVMNAMTYYMYVKEPFSETHFLWVKGTRHKNPITGRWDRFAMLVAGDKRGDFTIGEGEKAVSIPSFWKICSRVHAIPKAPRSHFDIIAVHEKDFMGDVDLSVKAIENAFDPEYIKKKLYPMVTDDRFIWTRTESRYAPAIEVEVRPLFRDELPEKVLDSLKKGK